MTPTHLLTRFCTLAFVLALALAIVAGLAGCSKQDTPTAPSPSAVAVSSAQSYDAVAKDGKGFTVGAVMSTQTVYVLFDAQCPHCGALWNSSLPLQKKVKFVWIPVSLMNAKSTLQGAALLTAANPFSQELTLAENGERNLELERQIKALGLGYSWSYGEQSDSSWREDGFVIFDVSLETAMLLARTFDQNAILYGQDARVALAWCDNEELEWFFVRLELD